jgi:hypothetical protein
MKPKRTLFIFSLLLVVCGSENAWALQSHGPPEGLYVHQMAHLLFSGALIYLYWHTRTTPVIASRGWKYLQVFCGFLIFWNLLAFTGHEALVRLNPDDFMDKGTWSEKMVGPISFIKVVYYIAKMDHFLNVPALLALAVSLRTFYLEALVGEEQ